MNDLSLYTTAKSGRERYRVRASPTWIVGIAKPEGNSSSVLEGPGTEGHLAYREQRLELRANAARPPPIPQRSHAREFNTKRIAGMLSTTSEGQPDSKERGTARLGS